MSASDTHRRRFLQGAAALAAAAGLGGASRAADPGAFPIVDTHQHLWDLKRFHPPWLAGAPKLDRSFVLDDYRRATAGLNVLKSVYMEIDVAPERQEDEANYVLELIRSGAPAAPMVAAVISGRPASAGFADYVARYQGQPEIKGLRRVLHGPGTPPGFALRPAFVAGVRRLGEAGLHFEICMRPEELADAVRLVDACPGTSFVLDHCGNANVRAHDRSAWKEGIARVAARKNVVAAKVSGIVASAAPGPWADDDLAPIVNHVLDEFGPERVVFGGDWPVCTLAATYRQWAESLRRIVAGRPEADRRKLFHDNAIRAYRLG